MGISGDDKMLTCHVTIHNILENIPPLGGKNFSASVIWGRKCEKGEEKKGKIRKDKDRGESEVKRVKYK